MEEAERLQSTRNRIGRDKKNQSNQLTIASVIMEEVERGGKKTRSTFGHGHCVSCQHSREM
jgi:hypothetical protein